MVTVAVQEEQRLFREGLAMVLAAEEDMTVVGVARSSRELLSIAETASPEVVILEADAHCNPVRVVANLRSGGAVRVIGLYRHLTRAQARELQAAGAGALIDRQRGIEPLFHAIRGEWPVRMDVTALASCALASVERRVLTSREIEVLGFVGKGSTSREIGELLGISRKTVDNHKQRTFQKLGVQNQAHAVSVAMRRGLFAAAGG